jgi:hypothetical protein
METVESLNAVLQKQLQIAARGRVVATPHENSLAIDTHYAMLSINACII